MAAKQDGTLSGRSTDNYLAVLGDAHRRSAVGFLAEKDHSVTLSSLARVVAAETQDVSLGTLTETEIEQTKMELHHNHLPKLDKADVVEYDSEEHFVTPADGLEPALRAIEIAN